VRGQFEIEPGVLGPSFAVLEIMGEAFLPRVEVDRGDALPAFSNATAICIATVDLPDPPFSLPSTTQKAERGRTLPSTDMALLTEPSHGSTPACGQA